VTGTIVLSATLPTITDANLTITSPGGGITIDGGGAHLVMLVGSIIMNLQNLTIAHGFNGGDGGGLFNTGTLTITNGTFSSNKAGDNGGAIENALGTMMTVTNSTFPATKGTALTAVRSATSGR
jgi:hypothetical protein